MVKVVKRKYSGALVSAAKRAATAAAWRYGRGIIGPKGQVALALARRLAVPAFKLWRSRAKARTMASRRKSMGQYRTTGTYVGRFKKRKLRKRMVDVFNRHGFTNTTEITGTVSDPDCVYVGHSTSSGPRILTVFLQACLRKLYKESANWTCTNVTDPILGYEGFGDGWRLILYVKDVQAGTVTTSTYDTTTTDTIARIVGDNASGVAPSWPNLYNFWVNYIGQASSTIAGSVQQPTRLALFQRDGNITNFYHFMGDIYFPNEIINLKVTSELKIQNRTLSATGSADAEDISNNPIVGRVYEVSSGCPRTRVEGADLIGHVIDATGVITRRAAEFPTATQVIMREPPDPKIFWNISKSSKVIIQPGNIKKDVITFSVRKPVYEFFQRLDWRVNTGAVASAGSMKSMGKSALYALEDIINVNAAQNISVAFEVNRTESCYLSTTRSAIAQGGFYQQTQSSNPA